MSKNDEKSCIYEVEILDFILLPLWFWGYCFDLKRLIFSNVPQSVGFQMPLCHYGPGLKTASEIAD